ncbi:MAG: EAL domain-containing protein [Lachnospiraceae bacterium]|nr:EAL domain-containing protein [Lachnospiraceae bacterium]
MFNALLQPLQNGLGSGLLVIFLTHGLWFFGIPVILNPIFFLPFLLVPISNYLISYAAFYTGLVPHVVNTVDWTTPILLSGYKATDSIAGTILQIVCLTVGVLTYIPFVRLYEQQRARRMKQDVKRLVEEMQQEEQDMRITHLTKREDDLGHIARILASELEDAVKKQELYLVYQPQVDRDENCIGAEALLRWEHAEFGFIYPPLIIQLAKEKKILSRIESFVFEEAASALATIQEQFGEPFKMSVNITNESLEWDGIEACIEKVVEQHHLSTNMFCLEITEQDALSSSINVTNTMEHLQQKGHRFLIDDFGMGHTSMMYLQTNYFDIVKLDGSLTKDVLTNERNSNIIEAIVYLGQSLHFKIIAEYVETETQRDKLKELGCDAFQGYLYSKPIRLKELLEWITKRKDT